MLRFRILCLLALWFVCPLGGVRADWRARVEGRASSSATLGEVVVNDAVVIRLRRSAAGSPPGTRALMTADRLRDAVDAGLRAEEIDVAVDREEKVSTETRTVGRGRRRHKEEFTVRRSVEVAARVTARGETLALATREEASAADAGSPSSLANNWARALRRALSLPGLTVTADKLVVPFGESRWIRLGGAARGPVTVSGAKAAVAAFETGTERIRLTGSSIGRETIDLEREGATTRIEVAVQPYAAKFDAPRTITVTGTSVPADRIAQHAVATALASVRATPGATIRVETDTIPASALTPGGTLTVPVPISVAGPEMIAVRETIRVGVVNRPLAPVDTAALLYSNNPERVTKLGTLFVARLGENRDLATRLLYHHQSAMDRDARFTVELINDDTDASAPPAGVQVIGGEAGPVIDTVWVGYRAASLFLSDYLGNVGALVEVPPGTRVALTADRLPPGQTISGLVQLRQASGRRPVLVRVAAEVPDESVSRVPLLPRPVPASLGLPLSEHVYPTPAKSLTAAYRVGERWTFISIGRVPITNANNSSESADIRKLEGNYGVFYDIAVTLENPTDKPATARIAFEPSAGLAGGIFLIDGKRVEVAQVKMPTEYTLSRYVLPPGAKQTVQIRTLPLSGSAYPATIIVRPDTP